MASRTFDLIPADLFEQYEFHEWRNAIAVLNASSRQCRILIALTRVKLLQTGDNLIADDLMIFEAMDSHEIHAPNQAEQMDQA